MLEKVDSGVDLYLLGKKIENHEFGRMVVNVLARAHLRLATTDCCFCAGGLIKKKAACVSAVERNFRAVVWIKVGFAV